MGVVEAFEDQLSISNSRDSGVADLDKPCATKVGAPARQSGT